MGTSDEQYEPIMPLADDWCDKLILEPEDGGYSFKAEIKSCFNSDKWEFWAESSVSIEDRAIATYKRPNMVQAFAFFSELIDDVEVAELREGRDFAVALNKPYTCRFFFKGIETGYIKHNFAVSAFLAIPRYWYQIPRGVKLITNQVDELRKTRCWHPGCSNNASESSRFCEEHKGTSVSDRSP
jgi:hypothetical protein